MSGMKLDLAAAAVLGLVLCFSNGCGDDKPGPGGGTENDAAIDQAVDAPEPTTDAQKDSGGNLPDVELPPIDPSLLITSLTDAQKRQFCDWKNAQFGGYGMAIDCGSGKTTLTDENQDRCLAAGLVTRCPITVQQYETCILAQAPSRSCDFPYEQCHYLVCQ
jgi:hypothetical protein